MREQSFVSMQCFRSVNVGNVTQNELIVLSLNANKFKNFLGVLLFLVECAYQ